MTSDISSCPILHTKFFFHSTPHIPHLLVCNTIVCLLHLRMRRQLPEASILRAAIDSAFLSLTTVQTAVPRINR
ncbi:hypothetical protein Bpfe_007671, partial [Biomphalaria pfeifferi]